MSDTKDAKNSNGVTELLADNPEYEGATGKTTNYQLPLYVRGDNFKVLTDQNIAMSIIDTTLDDIDSRTTSNANNLANTNNSLTNLRNTVTTLNGNVNSLTNRVGAVEGELDGLDTIRNDLIEQNNLIKNLTNRVLSLENLNVASMQTTLSRHDTKIRQLEPKVTYLERTQGVAYYKSNVSNSNTFSKMFEVYNGIRNEEPTKYMITFTCVRLNPIADTPIVVQYMYDSQNSSKILGVTKTHASMATDNTDKQVSISCTQVAGTDGNTARITGTVEPNGDQWGVLMSITPVCR